MLRSHRHRLYSELRLTTNERVRVGDGLVVEPVGAAAAAAATAWTQKSVEESGEARRTCGCYSIRKISLRARVSCDATRCDVMRCFPLTPHIFSSHRIASHRSISSVSRFSSHVFRASPLSRHSRLQFGARSLSLLLLCSSFPSQSPCHAMPSSASASPSLGAHCIHTVISLPI